MPSFDVVSEFDKQELVNAVDQSNREVANRFDFKDSDAKFEYKEKESEVIMSSKNDFQIKQMKEILLGKFAKRNIDVRFLEFETIKTALNHASQTVKIRQGLNTEEAKKLNKMIKDAKHKVQASIQGEQIRVSGKSRDELQTVIQFLRKCDFARPLQFINFRD